MSLSVKAGEHHVRSLFGIMHHRYKSRQTKTEFDVIKAKWKVIRKMVTERCEQIMGKTIEFADTESVGLPTGGSVLVCM